MKKKIFVLSLVSIAFILMLYIFTSSKDKIIVHEIDITEYRYDLKIEQFPSEINIGEITDEYYISEKVRNIFNEKFPDSTFIKRPLYIAFDESYNCWFVCGTLPPNMLGGVPSILIKPNGDVLAIWHGQ